MQKIKNIIFDLGGVVLNIDEYAVLDNIGKMGVDAKQLLDNKDVKRLMLDFETGRVDSATFRLSMKQLSGTPDLDDEEFDRVWCSMLLDFPKERIDFILKTRESYPIYLLSNTNSLHYDRFSSDFSSRFGFPFDSLFRQTFYSFRMGLVKPDVEIFKSVIKQTGVNPEETLFIDDNADNTSAAAKLGLRTLTIARNSGLSQLCGLLDDCVC